MSYDPNNPALLEPEEHVLTTLERDGSRRWMYPKLSKGRFLFYRKLAAYGLIGLFIALPFIKMNGHPVILLDILSRRFHLFGFTFLPTDTFLLALFILSVFLTIFLVTALLGRVWCGWGCPQTVYMEFVFRPIERFFDGRAGRGGKPAKPPAAWRSVAKYVVFFIVCLNLTHLFLAYFVSVEQLFEWSLGSPLNHPTAFAFILLVTAALMFHACVFREQLCIIACPYGRFQAALLDESSMIISYDPGRGEARGKLGKKKREAFEQKNRPEAERTVGLDVLKMHGDCIDCGECVTTCPTGIDIRDGLQMECIGCAQCIDACDKIMDRVGRPKGLIRYTSQQALDGKATKFLRPRVVIYPLLISLFFGLFLFLLVNRATAEVTFLRGMGRTFVELESSRILNQAQLKIMNRDEVARRYSIRVVEPEGVVAVIQGGAFTLGPGEVQTASVDLKAPVELFEDGQLNIKIEVSDGERVVAEEKFQMKGPYNTSASTRQDAQPQPEGTTP